MKFQTNIALLLAAATLCPAFLHAKTVAKFESLSGLVQYREKKGKWSNATIGMPLSDNTELQTGPTGKATLIFPNGSKITLNPGTLASLDQYAAGPYGTQTNMSLRVGRMNADIAKVNDANKRNHFRVRTPTVVAGVRGTLQEVGHTADKGSEVKLVESSSDVVDKNGRQTHVPQGGASQVTRDGTRTADQTENRSSTVTMISEHSSTQGEAEMALTTGDFSFSGNLSDLQDLFDLFDLFESYGFANQVTFQKL